MTTPSSEKTEKRSMRVESSAGEELIVGRPLLLLGICSLNPCQSYCSFLSVGLDLGSH